MENEAFVLEDSVRKPIVFRLIKKNQKPALEGRYYPSIKRLPSEEVIFDSKSGKNRTIRYAPGESSVYKDEQSPGKVVVGDIIFQNGTLRVDRTNPVLLEFLEKSNYNKDNPNRKPEVKARFSIVDKAAEAQVDIDHEIEQIKAGNAVLGMEFEDLRAYARVLGVNIKNPASMIKHDMLRLAKANPSAFLARMDDPVTKRQQVILDAAEFGIIRITSKDVSWRMGNSVSLITPVPLGESAASWFATWTMTDKDGERVFADIVKKIDAISSK